MTTRRLVLACAAAFALAGCDDEPPPPGGGGPIRVHVQDAATGLPVAGVKIAVMDPQANLPLAAPLASDADGVCDFSPLRGVTPTVLVFGGGNGAGSAGRAGWAGPTRTARPAGSSRLRPRPRCRRRWCG